MTFYYPRQIRFHETDGAGVVYFANVLTLCHEAYEASLEAAGVELSEFFSPNGAVIPVVRASVDFFRPMACGDRITIALEPSPLRKPDRPISKFSIEYHLFASAEIDRLAPVIAQAQTHHCCIDAETRRRQALSDELQAWLERWRSPD